MVATGLGIRLADVVDAARDWRLLARAGLVNYVAVPYAAVLLLLLLRIEPTAAAGFLILAVCPGAPFAPPLTALAGGNTAISAGLMMILAGSSVVVAPFFSLSSYRSRQVKEGCEWTPSECFGRSLRPSSCPCVADLVSGIGGRIWQPDCSNLPSPS